MIDEAHGAESRGLARAVLPTLDRRARTGSTSVRQPSATLELTRVSALLKRLRQLGTYIHGAAARTMSPRVCRGSVVASIAGLHRAIVLDRQLAVGASPTHRTARSRSRHQSAAAGLPGGWRCEEPTTLSGGSP